MKSKLTLVVVVAVILVGTYVLYSVFSSPASNNPAQTEEYVLPSLPVTEEKTFEITEFMRSPELTPDEYNINLYFVGNTFPTGVSQGEDKPRYVITFDSATGFFNVVLLERPFSLARQEAETYLKKTTGLQEKDLCVVPYTVSVPGYVDVPASGTDYRFSFCPDAIGIVDGFESSGSTQ